MCVQEEERLKQQNGGSINYLQNTNKKRTLGSKGYKAKNQHESGPSHALSKSQEKAPSQHFQHQPDKKIAVAPNQCLWCKETGHWQKDCPKWMKHMLKKGEDIITFVGETMYLSYSEYTWWIDSGATVHVANSMQSMHSSQILQRGRRSIKVANGVEADVEAIGDLPIKLHDGFILHFHDFLFVPSLNRNLISISCLAECGFECHFGAEKCLIKFNNKCACLAFRQDKLYKLSMHDEINVCDENVCETPSVPLSTNEKGKRKRIDSESSKLWHCRLGHILRGRIECLVKESILPLLEFLDLDQCVDCIKGKYVKQIKKGAK
jgi:hypothetical protein